MPALNKPTSITYNCIHGFYWRNLTGDLLAIEANNANILPEIWTQLRATILSSEPDWIRTWLPSGKHINTRHIASSCLALQHNGANLSPEHRYEEIVTSIAEIEHPDGLILGMLSSRPLAQLSRSADFTHLDIVENDAVLLQRKLKNSTRNSQRDVYGRDWSENFVCNFVEKKKARVKPSLSVITDIEKDVVREKPVLQKRTGIILVPSLAEKHPQVEREASKTKMGFVMPIPRRFRTFTFSAFFRTLWGSIAKGVY